MNTNEMKDVIRQWVDDVWNGGNLARADELLAADYVLHVGSQRLIGPAGFKQLCAPYRAAFPDLRVTIQDLVAEGDRVAWRFAARGTQTGELMGLPPSGKTMEIEGVVISRFSGDKWVEDWGSWDIQGMLQQLGAGPGR